MGRKRNQPRVQAIRIYLLKKSLKQYTDALRDDIGVTAYPLKAQLGLA